MMITSRLRNTFLKHRTNENKTNYKKQRNFCVTLLKKEEKNYFENLDTKNIGDNKTFWKTVKLLLSDKFKLPVNVTWVKKNDVISDNGKTGDVFNDFFTNAVKNINITVSEDILCEANKIKILLKPLRNITNTQVLKQ